MSRRPLALAAIVLGFVPGACSPPSSPAPRSEVLLLVTIDTLRSDRLGCGGDARARTPFLDALAARSAVYTNCRSVCGWTLPACASIVTGRMPSA
ncbi:MAG: sulfatase-like hydrolase/transferase, partial [bacterium]